MRSRATLLRCVQLASPSLPIGAYAYSQGLEMAIAGPDRPEAGDGEISPMDEFWPS